MKLRVDLLKRDRTAFKSGDQWYNLSKYEENLSLDGVEVGDELEVNVKGNWVKSLEKLTVGSGNGSGGSGAAAPASVRQNSDTRAEIARGTAIKAAAELVKEHTGDFSQRVSDFKELVEKLTNYVLTGKFELN